jgi:hypothetical protein
MSLTSPRMAAKAAKVPAAASRPLLVSPRQVVLRVEAKTAAKVIYVWACGAFIRTVTSNTWVVLWYVRTCIHVFAL